MIIKHKNIKHECLLDLEDDRYFSKWKWYYRSGYVGRKRTKRDLPGNHWVHLHREIIIKSGLNIPPNMVIDHINRNKMDNRKENLRIFSKSENSKNVSETELVRRRQGAKKMTEIAANLPRTDIQTKHSSQQATHINSIGLNRHYGKDNHRSLNIKNTQTGETFWTLKAAANSVGMNWSTLRSMLSGKLKNKTPFIKIN